MTVRDRLLAIWSVNRWLPSICLALLLAVGGVFIWSNQSAIPEMSQLERRYMQLQDQVRQARRLAAAEGTQVSIVSQAREDLRRFRALLPQREEFEQLIGEIFLLADEARLDISQITYSPGRREDLDLSSYGLGFVVQGTYRQVKEFLSLLEQSPRLIVIDSISLAGQKDEGDVGLRLALTTFFREEKG